MNSLRKRKKLYPVNVIKNSPLKKDVYYLQVSYSHEFKPGQVVALALNPEDDPRLYSIASGKDENGISILFDINPDGELTPTLAQLKEGDQIYISEPFGKFLCQETPAMWIATGTGIAPFVSIVKSGNGENVTLLHGSRRLDAFYFQDLFHEHFGKNYLRFCTSEKAEGIIEGRLTQYLKDQDSLPDNYMYYLCGSSQMVIDVREILIEKGIPFDRIIAEIYF